MGQAGSVSLYKITINHIKCRPHVSELKALKVLKVVTPTLNEYILASIFSVSFHSNLVQGLTIWCKTKLQNFKVIDCKTGGLQALKPVKIPKIWGVTGNIKSDFFKLILGVY